MTGNKNGEITVKRDYGDYQTVKVKGTQQMRDNYQAYEMACPCCNTAIANHKQMDLVQAIREYMDRGIRVTSWYRCPIKNKACGGYKHSKHMEGVATDLALDPNSFTKDELQKLIEHAVENGAKEIGIYRKSRFMHFGTESTSVRWNRKHNGIEYRVFYGN